MNEKERVIEIFDSASAEWLSGLLYTARRNKEMIGMVKNHLEKLPCENMRGPDMAMFKLRIKCAGEILQIMESLADEDIRYAEKQLNIKEN